MFYLFILSIIGFVIHAYKTRNQTKFNKTDLVILWVLCATFVISYLTTFFNII